MGKFERAEKVGLRNKETEKLLAVYPHKVEGTDEEIVKVVKDWYYSSSCSAEEKLRLAVVDLLTEEELKSNR
ncbi:MAG: hypothetical protein PHX08_09425 [Lachnospiraceae bacterium]|nr:hypothetical protein [Lachnospiraceae bacterium]